MRACTSRSISRQSIPSAPCRPPIAAPRIGIGGASLEASRFLAAGVATAETGAAPGVDGDSAVHVLVVDREGEWFARDVLFVAFVEFDRQRVQGREPLARR